MPRDLLPEIPDVDQGPRDLLPNIPNAVHDSDFLAWLGYPKRGIAQNLKENLKDVGNSPLIRALNRAQDVTQRNLSFGMARPGPFPVQPEEGLPYTLGGFAGDVLSSYLGGKALGPALKGISALTGLQRPEFTKELPTKLARSYLGHEAIPQEPSQLMGPGTAEDIKQSLIQNITEGRSLPQTQRSAAKDIRNVAAEKKKISGENFEKFFNSPNVGGASYEANLGSMNLLPAKPGSLGLEKPSLYSPNTVKSFNSETQGLYNKFLQDSTVKNAHKLQSQLGNDIGELQYKKSTNGLDQAETNRLVTLTKSWQKANDLIDKKFEGTPHEGEYQTAKKYHKENVVPFTRGALAKISSGEIKNPGNLPSIFKNREEGIARALRHLGPDFRSKILHAQLGEIGPEVKPDEMLNLERNLGEKGLGGYLTKTQKNKLELYRHRHGLEESLKKQHEEAIKEFERKQSEKDKYKKAFAGLAGVGTAAALGLSPATMATMGTAGYLSKPILDRIARAIIESKGKGF
jgi:hypothetical protein